MSTVVASILTVCSIRSVHTERRIYSIHILHTYMYTVHDIVELQTQIDPSSNLPPAGVEVLLPKKLVRKRD